MNERSAHPLLAVDPDLGRLLSAGRRELALPRLYVEMATVPPGEWDAPRDVSEGDIGLLVVDGAVSCELRVDDTVSAELLGPKDVLRPGALEENRLFAQEITWTVLEPLRVARLDARFAEQLRNWPEINAVLIDRLNARAQRLATAQAIAQLNGVDRRVIALMWQLAERWGHMTPEGVHVPLVLSHRMLSRLIGARRPSVSTAVGELARRGELIRRPDKTWVLTGDADDFPGPSSDRIVPIRRRLLGREEEQASSAERPAPGAVAVDAVHARHARLRASVDRLRVETEATLTSLGEATADARRLAAEARRRRGSRPAPPLRS
jgi:CRP/FNR family cyclic AMP-dependent transcriptional regulator